MAESHISSLSIAVVALTLLSLGAAEPELATEVCKKTNDFNFCRSVVYSDPRAATANQYELLDIVLRKAYQSASEIRNFIALNVNESGKLKKCLGDYNRAMQKLNEMLASLNDDSYYGLDAESLDFQRSATNCRDVLHTDSIISGKNENVIKLANICYVVSRLFNYHG